MSDRKVIVETVKLRKEYKGVVAVDDLDLQLEQGDIFGLIGPNGAGKTTTIKMLATLLKPSSGSAYIGGYDVFRSSEKVRGLIGYMPDFFGVYDDLKVCEYLNFFAAAYRIPRRRRVGLMEDVLELTDLAVKRDSYVRSLSRGMRQRLCLAKTLIHDPVMLLLDEPASGLDPKARLEIREILKELGNMGKTILVSSNILPELAAFCNKVGMIEKGKLLVSSDVGSLLSQLSEGTALEIRIHDGMERAKEVLERLPDVGDIDVKGSILKVQYTGRSEDIHNILTELVNEQIQVSSFHETALDLEDAFLKLTEGAVS
ncbi:ABC transporter ATP-binding protein [Candidatus Poribacteria bacterium]